MPQRIPPTINYNVPDPAIPEDENPMPVPLSRRGDAAAPEGGIDPRLLTGLSLPMLARRMRESREHG